MYELFNFAALLLKRDGWCQGKLRTGRMVGLIRQDGPRCIIGAVADAWDILRPPPPLSFELVLEVLRTRFDRNTAAWNDAPGRTAAEVIAMLEACAAVP